MTLRPATSTPPGDTTDPVTLEHTGLPAPLHSPDHCYGRRCPLHSRSNHHARTWPQEATRTGAITRRCPHGHAHPDPDQHTIAPAHNCDGCCPTPTPSPIAPYTDYINRCAQAMGNLSPDHVLLAQTWALRALARPELVTTPRDGTIDLPELLHASANHVRGHDQVTIEVALTLTREANPDVTLTDLLATSTRLAH